MHIMANTIAFLKNKREITNVSAHTKVTNVSKPRARSIKKAVKDH